MHSKLTNRIARIGICLTLASCATFFACNKNSDTVQVAQTNPNPLQSTEIPPPPVAVPAQAIPSQSPAASPASSMKHIVANPAGSKVDPNFDFGASEKAKPTPTPAPTPVVEVVDGKIKQQWQAPAETKNVVNPLKITPEVMKQGKQLYMYKCEQCHGAEGKGNGGFNDPKWRQSTNLASEMVQANTDGELFYKVTTNRDRHPATKILYKEEERWAIVAFLRTFKK
jgi:mono/diheme cytochrome c family protein